MSTRSISASLAAFELTVVTEAPPKDLHPPPEPFLHLVQTLRLGRLAAPKAPPARHLRQARLGVGGEPGSVLKRDVQAARLGLAPQARRCAVGFAPLAQDVALLLFKFNGDGNPYVFGWGRCLVVHIDRRVRSSPGRKRDRVGPTGAQDRRRSRGRSRNLSLTTWVTWPLPPRLVKDRIHLGLTSPPTDGASRGPLLGHSLHRSPGPRPGPTHLARRCIQPVTGSPEEPAEPLLCPQLRQE
ncbi:hypothetical protein ACRE_077170 [Hapsidospora chrysogenum ATCC 11550]|uniref:Uncharacterized protein n=1 Tax=Hapsidospora chrysogenum (strain ATCC 11550 / CBS 779.69 / DSM 880 / IAM 14645 / JCM 23072 / IMI 49137) TaxID=857340 RepID=A0A086SWT7_HAPC1|nr:hypothetical protein ACRE_077170 [Hapsidospora chrysogenum ATCC 11550]